MAPSLPASQPASAAASSLRLCDLETGARAQVVAVDATLDPGGRLADLGFVPGTPVRLLRRAPLGDPAVYALRGTRFCLRREQAVAVSVTLATAPSDALR